MNTRKSMRGPSDSNVSTTPNELPNKTPLTTTAWAEYLCSPSERTEAHAFVAVRRFSRADRGTRSTSANCEAR
jgi:hypothetical protein